MQKPITNLCITGITTYKQMKKLVELTGTIKMSFNKDWKNDYGRVYHGSNGYIDYQSAPCKAVIHLTWKQFLATYDKPCCKKELKKVKKKKKRVESS